MLKKFDFLKCGYILAKEINNNLGWFCVKTNLY